MALHKIIAFKLVCANNMIDIPNLVYRISIQNCYKMFLFLVNAIWQILTSPIIVFHERRCKVLTIFIALCLLDNSIFYLFFVPLVVHLDIEMKTHNWIICKPKLLNPLWLHFLAKRNWFKKQSLFYMQKALFVKVARMFSSP